MTAFLSAVSIFVWSIGEKIPIESKSFESVGKATSEYMKELLSFTKQAAFAGVTLFGVIFFSAFSTASKYVESTVSDKADIFLLNIDILFQFTFHAIYSIVGFVRYCFTMSVSILAQFKDVASRLDRENSRSPDKKSDE
jgi:hypothetical protein